MPPLFPALAAGPDRPALRFGTGPDLTYARLAGAAGALAAELAGRRRTAVWATPTAETAVGVVAALLAGVEAVPLNPRSGERELAHIVADCAPELVLAAPDVELPAPLAALPHRAVHLTAPPVAPPAEPTDDEAPALIVYTSGTTGPPKGAVLPRRAVAATLDGLAEAWRWTEADVLVHALPLFHVHGLILGVLGPLRRGGALRHLGRFTTDGVARELAAGGTVLFGVPTMYHRIAEALAAGDEPLAKALAGARLLVSGSAALPLPDHRRIEAAAGRPVIERYGMTETLITTAVPVGGPPRTGTVGLPLRGMELRLVDESGAELGAWDGETVGEIQLRGPSLFTGYLGRPDATAAAFAPGGWFRTGDLAAREPDGAVRIVGRRATDLIKSGGYKIGAGEVENALLDHPGVREAAVTGEPDPDLGERIVAWVVPVDPAAPPAADALAEHVARELSPHKRPRTVRFMDSLPRNEMGKIMKRALGSHE
ncbi:acyl-CoA synthetase [Streptomyces sp. 8K308]|uniref:acyl-CoA synthetase n=1 Tax=Streptomyces sp. 8K308 TaxID=2530388 RepID=UPI0010433CD4|nr:acyl-CoA synthetase [Streptomyces sp. 8K308]TDC11348.1 acyl-CoA synthetase [Streptomyces sp. 8K308]